VYDQQVLADEEQEELAKNDNAEVEVEIAMEGASFSTTVSQEELDGINAENLTIDKEEVNVLVLCEGGGTSGMLANALNNNSDDLKDKYGVGFTARGGHYGQHGDLIEEADVVILAPQVSSHLENMKKEARNYGAVVIATEGAEYIGYTRDSESAAELILKALN